jgi:hypothetical protein
MALPRGIRNNNPLNIVKGNSWKGERANQTDKRFEEFESMAMGLRAGFILLRNYIEGTKTRPTKFNTIRKIVSRWAPPSENYTQRYIDNVCKWSGLLPDEVVQFRERKKMVAIVQAMAKMECGVTLDVALIESAYDLV